MGFTRYWTYTKPFQPLPETEWKLFKQDVRKILKNNKENLNIPLSAGSRGETRGPIIARDQVVLNGVDDCMYEDLVIERDPTEQSSRNFKFNRENPGFRFCKTEHMPYDSVVWAVVQAFGERFKEYIVIDSD